MHLQRSSIVKLIHSDIFKNEILYSNDNENIPFKCNNINMSQNTILSKRCQTKRIYILLLHLYKTVKNRQNLSMVIKILTAVSFKEEGIGRKYEGVSVKLVMFYLFIWMVGT